MDGLLLQPEHDDPKYILALKSCPVPFVFFTRYPMGFDCDYVTHDQEYGAYLAAEHLFKKGHKTITI